MNFFLKSVLYRMSKSVKVKRIFSNQLKLKHRKYTTSINYVNTLEIQKKKTWNIMKDIIVKSKITYN